MGKSGKDLYDRVSDIMGQEEFQARIKELVDGYEELIDDYTAGMLLLDELGRGETNIQAVKDLKDGEDSSVQGEVIEIMDTRTFRRKDGRDGRVRNVVISDGTGPCKIVLWDKDTEQVEDLHIAVGDRVKVINGRVKDGRWGLEVSIRRTSLLMKG